MDNPIKVRIAPSPTGIPHIGTVRTAFFNYLFTKHNKGEFLLRIDDTDRIRFVPESEQAIYDMLRWLGLTWDGDPYIQSKHLDIYKKHLTILQEKDLVYEDNGAFRFKTSKTGVTTWNDAVRNKTVTFANDTQEDFVVIKSDGFPTYNFATVIDDHLMKITHIIRGEEFISSTPKHIQLYKAFEWNLPVFAHLPVILGPDKSKLSKRHGAKSALDYRDDGYLAQALLNYTALLGWNPGGDKEIMSMDEMIKLFDLKDINTANPVFDAKKLEWMNGIYIRQSQIAKLKSQILSQNAKLKDIDNVLLDKLIPLAQTRMKTLNDFTDLIKPFIEQIELRLTTEQKEITKELLTKFERIDWKREEIIIQIKDLCFTRKINMKVVYKTLTGKEEGLPLADTFAILGKEKTLAIFQT